MARLRTSLFIGAALAALASPAAAEEMAWGEGVEVMDEADLADHRGGFEIAGINVNFGATVTTIVDGAAVLSTQLTWTDAGAIIEQTMGDLGANGSMLTPDQLEAMGVAPNDTAAGVVLVDDTGVTEIVHNVTEGSLQNIIINSASGQDITQQIDVDLELPGFEMVQADLLVQRFGLNIADDMRGIVFFDPGG